MTRTLFPTGDKPTRPTRRPAIPQQKPVPAALTRAAVAATLADALEGLPPERRASVLAKAIGLLSGWEQATVGRLVVALLREVNPPCGKFPA